MNLSLLSLEVAVVALGLVVLVPDLWLLNRSKAGAGYIPVRAIKPNRLLRVSAIVHQQNQAECVGTWEVITGGGGVPQRNWVNTDGLSCTGFSLVFAVQTCGSKSHRPNQKSAGENPV